MEAMDKLVQLAESMCQAASLLLGDNDPSDESSPRRPSTFLNAVALGNVVSVCFHWSRRLLTAAAAPAPPPLDLTRSGLVASKSVVPASWRCPGGRGARPPRHQRRLLAHSGDRVYAGCQQVGGAPAAARASSSPSTSSPRSQWWSRPPSASPHAPTALDAIDEAVGKLKSVLDNGEGDLDEAALRAEELMAPLESHCGGWWRRLQ
ncbi:hypothetical protein OsJ_32424 [Oryza sativa Japonica Group]|uniref:Uncharacterized protein n=1 Tax=Oryza sativa subsp. japonica TaxID=39947 RepID=B9G6Y0_ORYSJ|nr:hypothetical protein OsJ_32424 [Oryza sativa Japonica Group]